jgi:hypothetical protein
MQVAQSASFGDIDHMTVLDRPTTSYVPDKTVDHSPLKGAQQLRCVVCHTPIDFVAGQTAIVLKHIAYGYDFAHSGVCEAAAREWISVEPGYDRPAFSTDGKRACVLRISSAAGWAAVVPAAPEQVVAGVPVVYEPLKYWALVEYRGGTRRLEGVIRASEWLTEPGGAEFPEARRGRYASLGYVDRMDV